MDFNPLEFVEDYDRVKLKDLKAEISSIEIDGRPALYLFNPDKYSLDIFIESEGYSRVGSSNYDKIFQSIPLSLMHLGISTDTNILVVSSEYDADYYIKVK